MLAHYPVWDRVTAVGFLFDAVHVTTAFVEFTHYLIFKFVTALDLTYQFRRPTVTGINARSEAFGIGTVAKARHFCNKQVSVWDGRVIGGAAESLVLCHGAWWQEQANTVPDCNAVATGFDCACNMSNGHSIR
jgi:hypothetical protein